MQATHKVNPSTLKIPGFVLTGHINSKHHGFATFVHADVSWSACAQSAEDAEVEWISTKVNSINIVNVYKSPSSRFNQSSLPNAPTPAIYAGDFSSRHTNWGYRTTNDDGEFLVEWSSTIEATLLYDPKEPHTFSSRPWNTNTNLDLAFAKLDSNAALPVRETLSRFPHS